VTIELTDLTALIL